MLDIIKGHPCPDCPRTMSAVQGTVQVCSECMHFRDTSREDCMQPYVATAKTIIAKFKHVPAEQTSQPVKKD